ncbi:Tho complex subunit 7/Mft1p [Hibiscus syriacus]|uniref:Tho complex subunit 7/Mft1p n=1 Tax=Hibiscus syriacus TaxID=106335 RepID=A0A6A3CDI8_HIBSY|nr:protein EXORDIUM-like 2 [Hibiscus syriacus]KAE8725199.1 Tho complex subunit 7/Mft1p [Hibiscus syriacus]
MSSFSVGVTFLILLSLVPSLGYGRNDPTKMHPKITYHGGPILNGTLNFALIWYGKCNVLKRTTIVNFLTSLNKEGDSDLQPKVTRWWQTIESYQSMVPGGGEAKAHNPNPKIIVNVAKQVDDTSYKYGRNLTIADFIPKIVHEHIHDQPDLIPIIITAKDVDMEGLCSGKCADHGLIDNNKPYIILGNPAIECPGKCEWPFNDVVNGPKSILFLRPLSQNKAADAMVIALATTLADMVTNPLNTGFYGGSETAPLGAGSVCKAIFGSGAFPGNPGKVHIDPSTSGSFNAHGYQGDRFLLPAVWNPETYSCWTLM